MAKKAENHLDARETLAVELRAMIDRAKELPAVDDVEQRYKGSYTGKLTNALSALELWLHQTPPKEEKPE